MTAFGDGRLAARADVRAAFVPREGHGYGRRKPPPSSSGHDARDPDSRARTTIERVAARQAREIRGRLGSELRTAREDAGISLSRLAGTCGMSKGQLHRIEAGTSQPGWEVLARLCAALGRRVGLTLYPDSGPLVRDHISAAMVEALLKVRHERWRPRLEVAVYRPVRGSIDLVLEDVADVHVVACEAQSDLRRIEQELRWFRAKADALAAAPEAETGARSNRRVDRLLLLRSTQRTRAHRVPVP